MNAAQHIVESAITSIEHKSMNSFAAFGSRLLCREGVDVEVYKEADTVVAACKTLHVFGAGDTPDEALADLTEQVVHFYLDYTSANVDDLSERAVEIRRFYCEHFEVLS